MGEQGEEMNTSYPFRISRALDPENDCFAVIIEIVNIPKTDIEEYCKYLAETMAGKTGEYKRLDTRGEEMNADEHFDQWWEIQIENGYVMGELLVEMAFMDAYRLGQQQGMEESAKICKLQVKDWSPTENAKYVAWETAKDIEKAIRQAANALKEIK